MNKPSCDIEEVLEALGQEQKKPAPSPMDKIPADRLAAMQKMARELKLKYPQMKENRIMRKVADYFKIKLT